MVWQFVKHKNDSLYCSSKIRRNRQKIPSFSLYILLKIKISFISFLYVKSQYVMLYTFLFLYTLTIYRKRIFYVLKYMFKFLNFPLVIRITLITFCFITIFIDLRYAISLQGLRFLHEPHFFRLIKSWSFPSWWLATKETLFSLTMLVHSGIKYFFIKMLTYWSINMYPISAMFW